MSRKKHSTVFVLVLLFVASSASALPEKIATVDVARFLSSDMQKGVPAGWGLERKSGTPVIGLERDSGTVHLNMKSDPQSSFGIKKTINVNVKEYPYLNWRWQAIKLPQGGDVRKTETDDQAIQVYIAFPATGFPAKFNTPIIGYIWDNEAPRDWTGRCQQFGGSKLRYLVLRNKTDKIGAWYDEKRNLYQDYRKLFKDIKDGEPAGPAQGISLYINSQHTRSMAESNIGDVYFSRH